MPEVIPYESRNDVYKRFCKEFIEARQSKQIVFVALLVDGEAPVQPDHGSWAHLNSQGMPAPARATDDNAHLMVQCMESWFMADKDTLADYYGQGFLPGALSPNTKIEEIPKKDIFDSLKNAARNTQKGAYDKAAYSFEILERINPQKVISSSPHAERLIETLRGKLCAPQPREPY